jgi:iron complex outermembrane recepter protein
MTIRIAFVAASLILMTGALAEQPPTTEAVAIDIPALPLNDALKQLARQAGFQVVFYSKESEGVSAPKISGRFTAAQALGELLAGTGLTYEFVNANTVAIRGKTVEAGKPVAASTSYGRDGMRIAQAEDVAAPRAAVSEDGVAGSRLDEIVVTAQKRMERLQDVPAPVTVISAEPLATHNQLRLQDYYSMVPGLALAATGNNGAPVVAIRGIFTGPDTNSTTGIVIDEVSYGNTITVGGGSFQAPDVDPSDVERIEVLRGPQGTLYGAASIGGLLKYVTVDPATDRFTGRVQVGGTSVHYSDDIGYSVRGNVNVPLSDTFAVRVSGFTVRDPGYIDNPETGEEDTNYRESNGGRVSALWRPADSLSLKLSALVQDTDRVATEEVDTTLGKDPKHNFLIGTGGYIRDSQVYSATLVAKLGRAELTSATGYSIDESDGTLDLTTFFGFGDVAEALYSGTGRAVIAGESTVKKFVQELRASIPVGERLNWLVGAFYTNEKISGVSDIFAANSAGVRPAGVEAGSIFGQRFEPEYEEYSAFSTLTVDLTDRWDIQFGGRYAIPRASGLIFNRDLGGPFVPGTPTDTDNGAFTYLVTPRWRISPDLMAYVRLASGYRPGGGNELCGAPQLPCGYDPDTTQNYDIGIKGSLLDGAFSYDASVYYIDWKDIQINQLKIPGDSFNTFTGNASGAKSQGAEFSIEARPARGTKLSGWVAYNDAELTEDFETFGNVGFAGDRLPYSSEISANLSVDQEFPLWGTATGTVGARVGYVGERKGVFQFTGVERSIFPSYVEWDLSAGLKYDTWSADMFINNVTDERGVLRSGLDTFFPTYSIYIRPRVIGLSLSKSF